MRRRSWITRIRNPWKSVVEAASVPVRPERRHVEEGQRPFVSGSGSPRCSTNTSNVTRELQAGRASPPGSRLLCVLAVNEPCPCPTCADRLRCLAADGVSVVCNLRSVSFYTYFLSLCVTMGNVFEGKHGGRFGAMRLERALHLFNIAESRWDVNITRFFFVKTWSPYYPQCNSANTWLADLGLLGK